MFLLTNFDTLGSPLLFKNNDNNNGYVLGGILNRILNAYDPDPDNKSCPLHDSNSTHFVNAFVKPSSQFNWIMEMTLLSKNALTNANHEHNYVLSSASGASLLWRGFRLQLDWLILLNIVYLHLLN
jgi:hypothetical protein